VLLAPVSQEAEPRERPEVGLLVGGHELDDRPDVPRRADGVVAADSLVAAPAKEELRGEVVGMRSERRVDDRMRPVDERQLRVAPVRPLAACVLAVPHLVRLRLQRLRGSGGVEVELDHLPVALVGVVPVVEDVEEPVLEDELARVVRIGDHPRVGRRLLALGDRP
jgi:hypothetical protein